MLGRAARPFKRSVRPQFRRAFSSASKSFSSRGARGFAAIVSGAVAAGAIAHTTAFSSADYLPYPAQPWVHETFPWINEMDKAGIRRGFEVYRQVCSTCHSMEFLAFRHLVGVSHSTDQAKALAASYAVQDGPDDKGDMFERPGRLSDKFPQPYPNQAFARFANNGALPPDLNCIIKGRPMGADYVFALLTGYRSPPHGIKVRDGMAYNPYFAGGIIGMPPPLTDGQLDFEDGTPATVSQMAKDVVTFLAWASEPESDERKKLGFKYLPPFLIAAVYGGYYKRFKWSVMKTQKNYWVDWNKPAKFH